MNLKINNKWLLVISIIAFVEIGVLCQKDCSSPAYLLPGAPNHLSSPINPGNITICKNILANSSCCSNQDIAQISIDWKTMRSNHDITSLNLGNALPTLKSYLITFNTTMNSLQSKFSSDLESSQAVKILKNDLDSNGLQTALNSIMLERSKCFTQLWSHVAGMKCSNCDPNYNSFYSQDFFTGKPILSLQEDVCTTLQTNCSVYTKYLYMIMTYAISASALAGIDVNTLTSQKIQSLAVSFNDTISSGVLGVSSEDKNCTDTSCPQVCTRYLTSIGYDSDADGRLEYINSAVQILELQSSKNQSASSATLKRRLEENNFLERILEESAIKKENYIEIILFNGTNLHSIQVGKESGLNYTGNDVAYMKSTSTDALLNNVINCVLMLLLGILLSFTNQQ